MDHPSSPACNKIVSQPLFPELTFESTKPLQQEGRLKIQFEAVNVLVRLAGGVLYNQFSCSLQFYRND